MVGHAAPRLHDHGKEMDDGDMAAITGSRKQDGLTS
jgi:hypothetical protein